jgi:uncharacterized repeat protein (TIGR01451 family)
MTRHGLFRSAGGLTGALTRGFIAVALGATSVLSLPALDDTAAAAVSPGPTIVTTANAQSPAAPGGLALATVVIQNAGGAPTATPVTMALTLPTGVTVQSAEGLPGTQWQCGPSATGSSCVLQSSTDSSAIALGSEDLTIAGLTLALAPTVSVGAGLPVGVAVSAPAGAGIPPDLTQATTTVTLAPLAAGQSTTIAVSDDIAGFTAGLPSSVTTTVRNLGPGTLGGSRSNVTATGLLPPGSTGWEATGPGWTCRSASGLPSCTWTGSSVAKGASVPALVISFRAPAAATVAGAPLEWTRTISATPTGGGTATVVTSALEANVAAPAAPEVSLEARLASPLGSVEAPATATVALRARGQYLVDPTKTVSISLALPVGFSYQSRSSSDAWTCAVAGGVLTCSRSADFSGAVDSALDVTLGISATAVVGSTPLSFTATVPGEPAEKLADNTAVAQVQIADRPMPATTLRLWNYTGSTASPYDGQPVALVAGQTTALGIDATNTGNAPIAASTNVTLTLDLPLGTTTTATTDVGSPAWTCSTATLTDRSRLTCTVRTSGALAIGGALPRLKAALNVPTSATDGPTALALALAAPSVPALAAAATVSAVVSHAVAATEQIDVATELESAPRAGGRVGTFTVTLRNRGTATSPGVATTVSLPTGISAVLPPPAGCVVIPQSVFGFAVSCRAGDPIAPGASAPPIVVKVRASAAATNPSVITVSAVPRSLPATPVTTTFSLPVLPPLSAVATATPSTITNVPAEQPQPIVVLDGTASSAIDATSAWKRVPQAGEPNVVFTGGGDGRTASFSVPIVTTTKTLHFQLTVTDGATTSTAAVSVVVEPLPVVPPGGTTGWETTEPAPLGSGLLRLEAAATPIAPFAASLAKPFVALAQNVTPPSISGFPFVGQTLVADEGTWDQEVSGFAYAWLRCDVDTPATCAPVPGATNKSYFVSTADQTANGSVIRVDVTATLGTGAVLTARSAPTGAVSGNEPRNIVPPTIVVPAGGARVGATLQVQPGTWSRFPTISATEYRWSCSGGGAGCPGGPIAGATSSSYTLTANQLGGTIRVTETARFSDTGGSADSAPVGPVLAADGGGGGTPSATLCRILTAVTAQGTGAVDISLANPHIRLNFANATVTSTTCTTDAVIDVTGASIQLFDWMRIEGVNVHITNTAIDITGGTLTVPGDATLSGMNFRVISSGLHIPLNAAGGEINIAGRVIADSLPFLRLPGGWQAGAQIGLSSSGGVQQISFDAIAWVGAATTSPDALPVPPANADQLALQGSMATNKTFSFALSSSGLVRFAGSGLGFTGTVARATPTGATAITASAELAGAVTLASGVALETAALAWNGTTFTGSGTLGVTANGGRLAITTGFNFTDASAWSATLSITGAAMWTPASGITITNPTVTGTISRTGPTTNLAITIGAASIGFGPSSGTPATSPVTFTNLSLAMNASCLTGTPTPCQPAFAASGTVRVAIGSLAPVTVTTSGSLNMATGAFSITAALGAITPFNGLTINRSALTLSGGNGQPRSVSFTGAVTVLGLAVNAVVTIDDLGVFVRVNLGNWAPGTGAPTFNGASIVYATYATTTTVGATTLDVAPNTVYLTAATSAPKWLSDRLNTTVGPMVVQGEINLATKNFDVKISIDLPSNPALFSVNDGKVTLRVSKVALRVKMTAGSILTELSSNATITMPNSSGGGTPTNLGVTLVATYGVNGLTGSVVFDSDWQNAFGINGLTITKPSMSITLGAGVSVGFTGGVVLPTDWSNLIGLTAGTPINLTASLGTAASCFGINAGSAGSNTTVLDMMNAGALTASYISFEIAPTGCTVGTKTIPPGVSLVFDGKVLGTPLSVNAAVTPGTPVSFTLDATLGSITASGFQLDSAHLLIENTPVIKAVSFSASGNVFGVNVAVAGTFAKTPTGTKAQLTGQVGAPNLGGFELNNFQVTLRLEQAAAVRTITASANLEVTILGAPQAVSFTFAAVNGIIKEATADAAINIPVNGLAITGTGHFHFVQGQFPEITVAGTATVDGRSLTTVTGTLNRGGLTFSATVTLPPGIFASTPTVAGAIAWKSDGTSTIQIANRAGTLVTAQPGDFRFDATNLGLTVSGFAMNANLTIGKVSGTFWAEIATDLTLGVPGNGGSIKVVGSFASNGDFALSGSAALTIANAQLPSGTFSVVRSGASLTVSADISFSVPKLTTVRFQGTFSRSNTSGTTFDLVGTGEVRPGGYNFGSGTFHLYRGGNGETALSVQITIEIPGLTSGTAYLIVNGQDLEFVFFATMNGRIGDVLGNPTAGIWYQNKGATQSFSFYLEARDVLAIKGQVVVYGFINSDKSYSLNVAATAGPWGGSKDIGVCTARYNAQGQFNGTISGTGNNIAIAIGSSISVSASCGKIGVGIGVTVRFTYTSPTRVSMEVKLDLDFGLEHWKPTVFSLTQG